MACFTLCAALESIIASLTMCLIVQSLENDMVRAQVLKLVSLPLWHSLSDGRLKLELHAHPSLGKRWHRLAKKEAKDSRTNASHCPIKLRAETTFIPSLLSVFLEALEYQHAPENTTTECMGSNSSHCEGGITVAPENHAAEQTDIGATREMEANVHFCERFVEFMVDLLSQLPTRRFVRTFLDDRGLVVRCKMSDLFEREQGNLFAQLVDHFDYYMNFNIDDHSGRKAQSCGFRGCFKITTC